MAPLAQSRDGCSELRHRSLGPGPGVPPSAAGLVLDSSSPQAEQFLSVRSSADCFGSPRFGAFKLPSWRHQLFATPWTVARQALLSMGFSRQEYWSGLPCPPPGDLPNPGIEPTSLTSPALAGRFFTTHHLGSPIHPGTSR